MSLFPALLRRWAHCFWTLHRPVTGWECGRTTLVACECGRVFYNVY